MLRVGLTGDLGSGKSTVARLLAAHGAIILSSDEMARTMMQPGQPVYLAIVKHFGPEVLAPDSALDRRKLAQLAFSEGRAEELNALVHPAVLAEQAHQVDALALTQPNAIVIIESALIFSTRHTPEGQPWTHRFDRILLVTATEARKIERYIDRIAAGRVLSAEERTSLEADARRRLALQANDACAANSNAANCIVIANNSGLEALQQQVDAAWRELEHATPLKSS